MEQGAALIPTTSPARPCACVQLLIQTKHPAYGRSAVSRANRAETRCRPRGANTYPAHPLRVKAVEYRWVKDGVGGASDLADLLRMGHLPEAWIAPPAAGGAAEGAVGSRAHSRWSRSPRTCPVPGALRPTTWSPVNRTTWNASSTRIASGRQVRWAVGWPRYRSSDAAPIWSRQPRSRSGRLTCHIPNPLTGAESRENDGNVLGEAGSAGVSRLPPPYGQGALNETEPVSHQDDRAIDP